MFDTFLEKLKKVLSSRLLPISIVYIALFIILADRLFQLQIVEGETHSEENSYIQTEERELKSTRGNILDRNGKVLAYNEISYSIVMEDATTFESNDQRNAMIHKLVQLIEKNGDELDSEFYIEINNNGEYEFNVSGAALTRFKKNAYAYVLNDDKSLTEEQTNASAKEVFDFLRYGTKTTPMFNISDEYTEEEALKIMAIRYAIFINFPKYMQITIASNVSENTVAAIKENNADLIGVTVQQESYRVYNDSEYFSHILGYTGRINSEELETLSKDKEDYYNSTDIIGKIGIEKEFESYLSGTKGQETVSVSQAGKVLEVLDVTEPEAGSDVYLTIDSELQKAAYHVLESKLAGILLQKINPGMDYGSKGESASDILIPIYEVYYALINNNIIDIHQFDDPDASELEQSIYQKFLEKQDEIFEDLKELLALNSTTTNTQASGDLGEYLEYIYTDLLVKNNVIIIKNVDTEDTTYQAYKNNKISLSEYLQYAIANNWIDLSKLEIGTNYYSTDEIYEKLVDYVFKLLNNDSTFDKKIYRTLVFSYKLSGKEICLLLIDQDVIKYSEDDVSNLQNGYISPYNFILKRIENLEITPAMLALEPCSGSIVITDPNNGDVLAMVSYPGYDINKFANKIDSNYYSQVYSDLSMPYINRPTTQRTAPGSTFKMLSAITGLEEGTVGLYETIYDGVVFDKTDPPARCWSDHSHGHENVVTALRDSCNYYFYELGFRLGNGNYGNYGDATTINKLTKYIQMFGLDAKTGIELVESTPNVSNTSGIRSMIGQGNHNYTPVQIARYVSTIANGGTSYNLTILDQIKDKDSNVLLTNNAEVYNNITNIKDSTWDAVQEGMYMVVNDKKASIFNMYKDLEVKVAGKTGTAQESKSKPNHALFVSYAPYEDPEISVTVVIPNGYTSSNSAEVARDIYSYYYGESNLSDIMNNGAERPESNSITD